MDGYESVRRIREIERQMNSDRKKKKGNDKKTIPIVAITADAFVENKDRCIASGMNDIMTKPVIFDQLAGILRKYLKNDG